MEEKLSTGYGPSNRASAIHPYMAQRMSSGYVPRGAVAGSDTMQLIPQSLLRNKSDIINMIEIVSAKRRKTSAHLSSAFQTLLLLMTIIPEPARVSQPTNWRGKQATGRVVRGEMGLGGGYIGVCVLVCLCTCFVLRAVFVITVTIPLCLPACV